MDYRPQPAYNGQYILIDGDYCLSIQCNIDTKDATAFYIRYYSFTDGFNSKDVRDIATAPVILRYEVYKSNVHVVCIIAWWQRHGDSNSAGGIFSQGALSTV